MRDLLSLVKTYLVLDKKLDTLNWSGSSLRDGSGNTAHQEIHHERLEISSVS